MSFLTKNHIINQQKNQISDIIQFETMEYQIEFEAQQQTNFFSFQQAGSIRKGDYCMLLNHPTKIVDINVSKPGKHGSAKAVFIGVDIFTNKKYQQIFSTSENVMVPKVQKYELKVADINDDDFTALILPDYSLRQDLKLPVEEDLNKELRQVYQRYADQQSVYFTIMKTCGKQKIISARATKN